MNQINPKVLEKMAKADAHEWLSAEMFFGEGAGTRRKLVHTPIYDKRLSIPGYEEAFQKAVDKLDLTKYAEAAVKERKKIDAVSKAGKNFRALKAGKLHQLSTGVYLVAGGYLFFYHTEQGVVIRKDLEKAGKRISRKAKKVWRTGKVGDVYIFDAKKAAEYESADKDVKARRMYNDGYLIVDIAEALDTPESTVRAWLHD